MKAKGDTYLAKFAGVSSRRTAAAFFFVGCLSGVAPVETAIAAAPPSKSNTVPDDAAEAASAAQDEILVTAHRQHGAVATEVPPEVTLNSTVIESLGAADLTEVFRELAPELGSAPTSSNAPGNAPIVLVNGQRIAGFSSIKDFPPEAVRRIEIFPEKVALQYGYGADQRVVNVVLRDAYRALTLLGRYTLAPNNWRGVYRAKLDLIRIGETSHWNLALDYSHVDSIFAGSTFVAPSAVTADTSPVSRHTLAAQDDHLTASGAFNRTIGTLTAELTASLDLDTLQSRPGLSDEDGGLLEQEALTGLASGPYNRLDQTVHARTNLTLNGTLGGWRWSAIGRLDEDTRVTRTNTIVLDTDLDTVLLPSPGLLGERCTSRADAGCASTHSRRASSDFYFNGDLVSLPAGAISASVRTGFAFSGIRGDTALRSTSLDRDEASAQANIDFPIASRDSGLGKVSVGFNGEAHRYSDIGILHTFGSTLDWSPAKPVNVLVSFSRAEQAPSLLQLGEATLVTPDLREYDFVAGTTTIVQRSEGGAPALTSATSRIAKARLQVSPFRTRDLALSVEYTLDHTRNPIINLTAATAAAMAVFPARFTRENGFLTAIDVSPVNAARRSSQQIRWGINYSTAFGPAWAARTGATADRRDQFQIALYDTWHLQDDVVLSSGQRALDLTGGDIIGDTGGTPAHQIELQTSVAMRAFSADISGVWQAPTTARAGALSSEKLTFSQGITLNLRLQINLANQQWLTRRLPFLRGSLNLSADNLLGAHTTVHDANGVVPLAYSSSYVNPTGRTFRITLRKRFR